jgi:predicted amidohydrolase
MARLVRIASIQPPAVGDGVSYQQMQDTAISLVGQAGTMGTDVVCLPEYANCMGDESVWQQPGEAEQDPVFEKIARLASSYSMYVILPLLEGRDGRRYNTSVILDRTGEILGRYDKTHLTAVEREDQAVTAGDDYPVFDLDFGRIGIMTCYDGHFPEVARLLGVGGAEIIFFPSLQRRLTAEHLELQVRCRAIDNCLWVVRSSYGYDDDVPWMPGLAAGKSCIVDFEGTVLADAGPRVGMAQYAIDLDRLRTKERSFGGALGDARTFLLDDRRPSTYGALLEE